MKPSVVLCLSIVGASFGAYCAFIFYKIQKIRERLSAFKQATPVYPFVGSVPYLSGVNPDDGGTDGLQSIAQQLIYEPFVVHLLGRDHLLVVSKPEHCALVIKSKSLFQRSWAYQFDSPVLGATSTVLFANSGPAWEAQRKRLNPLFKPSVFKSLFDEITRATMAAETTINQHAENGTTFDLKPILQQITFQVIYKHLFGEDLPPHAESFMLDFYAKLMGDEFLLRISGFGWYVIFDARNNHTLFYAAFHFGRLPLPSRLAFFRARANTIAYLRQKLQSPPQASSPPLIHSVDSGVDLEEQLADVLGVILAGFETTANTVCWLIYYLIENKAVHAAVMSELAAIEDSSWENQTVKDNTKLLMACFLETLRLRPPAPGHAPDVVAVDGVVIDGKTVPVGTTVYAFFSAYYRNEECFDNPTAFDPYRWIDGRVETAAAKHNMPMSEFFAPFLFAHHVCLGKMLAEIEAMVVTSKLLRRFSFTLVGDTPKSKMAIAVGINKLTVIAKANK